MEAAEVPSKELWTHQGKIQRVSRARNTDNLELPTSLEIMKRFENDVDPHDPSVSRRCAVPDAVMPFAGTVADSSVLSRELCDGIPNSKAERARGEAAERG